MSIHPRLRARATRKIVLSAAETDRVLALAPDHEAWIRSELAGTSLTTRFVRSVGEVVSALVEAPPPRPQILIVDFDEVSPGELLHLHSIREQGWFGSVIAIGRVAVSLRTSLGVDRCVTVGPHRLRPIAALEDQHSQHTMRLSKTSG